MSKCRFCGKAVNVEGAKWCPFCGKRLQSFTATEEQDAFLMANKDVPRDKLAEMFNERFGTDKTRVAIAKRCMRIGANMSKEARYGTRKNGHEFPIGTERVYRGWIWVKVSEENDHHTDSRFNSKNWKRKHYLVWEQHHGHPVPKGNAIVFLDGNPLNCDIKNLYCTSKQNAIMTSNKLIFDSQCPQTKKAALQWGECYLKNKELKK